MKRKKKSISKSFGDKILIVIKHIAHLLKQANAIEKNDNDWKRILHGFRDILHSAHKRKHEKRKIAEKNWQRKQRDECCLKNACCNDLE